MSHDKSNNERTIKSIKLITRLASQAFDNSFTRATREQNSPIDFFSPHSRDGAASKYFKTR